MKSSPLAVKSFKIKWENPICGSEKIMINQKVKDNNKQARENYHCVYIYISKKEIEHISISIIISCCKRILHYIEKFSRPILITFIFTVLYEL